MIQLCLAGIRHQPGSALTLWFQDRINRNGGRRRKTLTIVALARKLLVALWKYVSARSRDRRRPYRLGLPDDSPRLPRIQSRNPRDRDQS